MSRFTTFDIFVSFSARRRLEECSRHTMDLHHYIMCIQIRNKTRTAYTQHELYPNSNASCTLMILCNVKLPNGKSRRRQTTYIFVDDLASVRRHTTRRTSVTSNQTMLAPRQDRSQKRRSLYPATLSPLSDGTRRSGCRRRNWSRLSSCGGRIWCTSSATAAEDSRS